MFMTLQIYNTHAVHSLAHTKTQINKQVNKHVQKHTHLNKKKNLNKSLSCFSGVHSAARLFSPRLLPLLPWSLQIWRGCSLPDSAHPAAAQLDPSGFIDISLRLCGIATILLRLILTIPNEYHLWVSLSSVSIGVSQNKMEQKTSFIQPLILFWECSQRV